MILVVGAGLVMNTQPVLAEVIPGIAEHRVDVIGVRCPASLVPGVREFDQNRRPVNSVINSAARRGRAHRKTIRLGVAWVVRDLHVVPPITQGRTHGHQAQWREHPLVDEEGCRTS